MRPVRLVVLLTLVALLAPLASAASAKGELETTMLRLPEGARVTSAGLGLASDPDALPVLELHATGVSIQRIGASIVRNGEPGSQTSISNKVSDIDERGSYQTATLTLAAGEGAQIVALVSDGLGTATLGATDVRGVGAALLASVTSVEDACTPGHAATYCLDAFGTYELAASVADAALAGKTTLLLYGPTLHVVGDSATTDYASGVEGIQSAGPVTQTEEAWVVMVAESVTGTFHGESARIFSAAPTIEATTAQFLSADGAMRIGLKDYRAHGDDVTAAGALIATPGPVAPGDGLSDSDSTVYASSFGARVTGDVQSVDLTGSIAFLDTPAQKAGAAALLALVAGAVAYAWQHVSFGFAALYTRLNKPDILENDVRNHIYDIIRQHPGISAREVHRQSTQSWGTVVYHLRQLERHHLVVSRALGRTRNYYENHGKYKGMEAQLACLQSERALTLARAIVAQPGITQEQLAAVSGFPQPTTSYYVRKLKQAGLCEEQREGRYVKYVPHVDLPRYIQLSESSPTTAAASATGVQA
ncbi:MAG TPA: winged helix-turn-helix transcriptional regulator [Candidatus Thermoplasmatota archaeon]|nr:winged helix-turn-helix transcriptional regulator [Candidatus Thermoplasmatota archaeon]